MALPTLDRRHGWGRRRIDVTCSPSLVPAGYGLPCAVIQVGTMVGAFGRARDYLVADVSVEQQEALGFVGVHTWGLLFAAVLVVQGIALGWLAVRGTGPRKGAAWWALLVSVVATAATYGGLVASLWVGADDGPVQFLRSLTSPGGAILVQAGLFWAALRAIRAERIADVVAGGLAR